MGETEGDHGGRQEPHLHLAVRQPGRESLADSARFNEAAELPKHEIEEIPRNDGSVLYIGRARIRHQNNTLILGPGGYEFGDYWRMGLPLEVLIFIVAMPMVLWVWPL